MNNSVVIGGTGMVGKATMLAFGIEKQYSRSEANITLEEIADCKYIFICLPTPTVDGKCFTDDIYEFIKTIINIQKNKYPKVFDSIFIIRSTVYPGFGKHVQETLGIERYVSNPEFLSEDTWEADAKRPQMIVLGADNIECGNVVKGIYESRYKYLEPILTTTITAETIKYTLNTFFATKVVFANEIYDFAQEVGANYVTIKQVLETHPWGSKNHFRVDDKGGKGAGGRCLPKDLEAFVRQSGSVFLQAVYIINQRLLEESKKS